MDTVTSYLNTDLVLTSPDDLTALADALAAHGVSPLHVTHGDNGRWYATFETNTSHTEPEPNIAAMLDAIESLIEPLRSTWDRCTLREFNIGYECGAEPWGFNQGLSVQLINRLVKAGASLRITLYPVPLVSLRSTSG